MSDLLIDKAFVQRRLDRGGYDVFMTADSSGGAVQQITDITATVTVDSPGSTAVYSAALHLPDQATQVLFQAMWDAGLRPATGESGSAHVSALERHLADMRALAMTYAMPQHAEMAVMNPDTSRQLRTRDTEPLF